MYGSRHEAAAVEIENRAANISNFVRGQERHAAGQLLGSADASYRHTDSMNRSVVRPLSCGRNELTGFLRERDVARYTWPECTELFANFPRSASLNVQKPALVKEVLARNRA